MDKRGFIVDHSTINRWVVHYSSQLERHSVRKKHSLERDGVWMKHTSKLKANGNIFTAL